MPAVATDGQVIFQALADLTRVRVVRLLADSLDMLADAGVIAAGFLVAWTGSRLHDLVIGAIVAFIVAAGALRIVRLR